MWSTRTSPALQSVVIVILSLWHITAASSSDLPVSPTSDFKAATDSFPQSQSTIAQQLNHDSAIIAANIKATLSSDLHTGTTSLLNIDTTSAVFSDSDTITSWRAEITSATQYPSLDLSETSLPSIQPTPTLLPSQDSITTISASVSHIRTVCVTVPYSQVILTDSPNLEPSRTFLSNTPASNAYLSNTNDSNANLSIANASDTYLSNILDSNAYLSNTHAFGANGSEILADQTPMLITRDGITLSCTTEEVSPFPSASIAPSHTNTFSSGAQTYSNSTNDTTENIGAATKPSTTVSTRLTTVPAPYAIVPDVSFPFQIKYDVQFHEDLEDASTNYYKEAVVNYTNMIKPAYENVTGFRDVTITKFWNGSVGVDYSVVIAYNLTDEEFVKEMEDIVYPFLEQSGVNKTFLRETFNKSIQRALDVLEEACHTSSSFCTGDYLCMLNKYSKPYCHPLCTNSEAINKCQNGGRCVQDAPNNFICRCPEDTTFLYGGQYCEVKAEKLGLKKDYIIAIACGGGGGIILILIIIIIILSRRRRSNKRSKNDKDNASGQSFKSIKDSEDGLHQNLTGIRNSSLLDYSNPTFSLPDQRTENVQLYPRSAPSGGQKPAAHPLNPTNNYGVGNRPEQMWQSRPEMEAAKPGVSHPLVSPSRTSSASGDQPGTYPHLQRIHPPTDYVEIQDADSKAFMYQPTRAMTPLTEFHQGRPLHSPTDAKVYDYSNREQSRANPERSGLYDFKYENSTERGSRMNDPYSIRRPHLVPQK